MRIARSAGYAVGLNTTVGNFQYQQREKKSKEYKATPSQLKRTAARITQSGPQKIHPLTALYFLAATIAPGGVLAKPVQRHQANHSAQSAVHSVSARQQPDSAANATSLSRSLRSVNLARSDMPKLPRRVIPIHADVQDIVQFQSAAPAQQIKQAKGNSEENGAEEWNKPSSFPDMSEETRQAILDANQQVFNLLGQHRHEYSGNHHVSRRMLMQGAIEFSLVNEEYRADLARYLLRATANYGAHLDETIPMAMQKKIIRDWIALNLFGKSINDLIATLITSTEQADHLRSTDLHRFIIDSAFRFGLVSERFKPWILMEVLTPELPMLAFFETTPAAKYPDCERLATMKLAAFEWGQIHAGLSFSGYLGLGGDIDLAEAAELGKMLLCLLQEGAVPIVWWEFFRLPAIIRSMQDYPDLNNNGNLAEKSEREAKALLAYASAHEDAIAKYFPLAHFKNLLAKFKTRPQLAQKIINSNCPGMDPTDYLNKQAPNCPLKHPIYVPSVTWLIFRVPGPLIALPDINLEFQKQIDTITAPYQVIDNAVLVTAWNALAVDDVEFIDQAEIKWVQAYFTAEDQLNMVPFVSGNQHARQALARKSLAGVEFFSAQQPGKTERVYALRSEGLTYTLTRVDKTPENYYPFFPDDVQSIDQMKLKLPKLRGALKTQEESIVPLLKRIAEKHGADFRRQLYQYGFEKTGWETITDILLSFIPFYSCITAVRARKEKEVVMSCGLDAISLLPLIGNFAKISIYLGKIFGKGILLAMREAAFEMNMRNILQVVLRNGGKTFAQYAVLPTSEAISRRALVSLGAAALRTLDPGIELIASIGQSSIGQAVHLLKSMSKGGRNMDSLLARLEAAAQTLPQWVAQGDLVRASLPGSRRRVLVARLAGDDYLGQPVYVQINRETGAAFGRKYQLLSNNILEAIPVEKAIHLQNLLQQGLGGKGAVTQAHILAEDVDQIDASLLRRLQQGISGGENMETLAKRFNVALEWLSPYILNSGQLTNLGMDIVDLAEAGLSTVRPKPQPFDVPASSVNVGRRPIVSLETRRLQEILADENVKRSFIVEDGRITTRDEINYLYDIDLNVFVEQTKFKSGSGFVYVADDQREGLIRMTIGEAQDQSSSISYDQRSAVLKAFDIDLDISAILNRKLTIPSPKTPIPKRISFVWVGNQPINDALLTILEENLRFANTAGFKVYFYLSEKSKELNYANLKKIFCDPAFCLPAIAEKNELKILEKTDFYQRFSTSRNFHQYQDAIDGNVGIATNFASATDILRLALIMEKGGLYLDIDRQLQHAFGTFQLEAENNTFLLSELLSSSSMDMDHSFSTSFFGSLSGNTVIDDVLLEMDLRYRQKENQDFYKVACPDRRQIKEFDAYAKKLSYLTGPSVFNTVLLKKFPALNEYIALTKLQTICYRASTAQLFIQLEEKIPSTRDIAPLADCSSIGNLHSWEYDR